MIEDNRVQYISQVGVYKYNINIGHVGSCVSFAEMCGVWRLVRQSCPARFLRKCCNCECASTYNSHYLISGDEGGGTLTGRLCLTCHPHTSRLFWKNKPFTTLLGKLKELHALLLYTWPYPDSYVIIVVPDVRPLLIKNGLADTRSRALMKPYVHGAPSGFHTVHL